MASFGVLMLYMVKNLSKQFYLFRACTAEKSIINDKYIAAFIIGKRFDFLNDSRNELKRKFAPVDIARIHEAIKVVLIKGEGI